MFESYNNPYNPYYNYNYNSQLQQAQNLRQNPQVYRPQNAMTLQGKVVDSLDVVKATDIPYDGSVSYFPLTDNSAIITKQLQQDGTSKMIIYKPIVDTEAEKDKPKYITETDFKEQIKDIDSKYITADDVKEQIKNANSKDIKDLKEDIKILKRKLEDIADDMKYKKEK